MANVNLTNAKNAKYDEFYTQFHDIDKEISAYFTQVYVRILIKKRRRRNENRKCCEVMLPDTQTAPI